MSLLSSSPHKARHSYVAKLNHQIQAIEDQAAIFNLRESIKPDAKRSHLKVLSQPKYQQFLLNPNFNPEKKEI